MTTADEKCAIECDMGLTSYQKIKILSLSILLLVMALYGAQTHAASSMPKQQLLEKLQSWKDKVSDSKNMNLREKDLQIDLIGRLMFQSQSKYPEQDLQVFMLKVLHDMQETDDHVYFLENLEEGLSTLLEKNEDVVSFMQAYLEFSGILEAKSASDFAEIRNYYDGRSTLQAKTMSLDEAADLAEQKEKEAAQFRSSWVAPGANLIEQYKEFTSETKSDPDSTLP
jgi:hypothetical protein